MTRDSQAAGTVNLAVGHPSESLLPHAVLASAADAAAAKLRLGQQAFNLGYGRIAGELPVLEALAAFLTQSGGEAVRADRLFLTNGVSHSLELVCAALLRPGDTVLVRGSPACACSSCLSACTGGAAHVLPRVGRVC